MITITTTLAIVRIVLFCISLWLTAKELANIIKFISILATRLSGKTASATNASFNFNMVVVAWTLFFASYQF